VQLNKLINMIEDESLRRKVRTIVKKPPLLVEVEEEGLRVEEAPAGIRRHHSYPRGLLEHTMSTAKIALSLCDSVETIYNGEINRDYVLAGVILHDIMKAFTYREGKSGGYAYTELGQRLDHLSLVVAEGYRRGLPIEVLHILASHHGDASPSHPHTLEALVVSIADLADSKLVGDVLSAAKWGLRDCVGEDTHRLSAEEAFKLVRARQTEGCEGVKRAFEGRSRKGEPK